MHHRRSVSIMLSARARASSGGTALPICLNCAPRDPVNLKLSGKLCSLAASLTDMVRLWVGCMYMYPSLDRCEVTVQDGLSADSLFHLSSNESLL